MNDLTGCFSLQFAILCFGSSENKLFFSGPVLSISVVNDVTLHVF